MAARRPSMGSWVVAKASMKKTRLPEENKKNPVTHYTRWQRDDTIPVYGMYIGYTNVYDGETYVEWGEGYPYHIFSQQKTYSIARLVPTEKSRPVYVLLDDIEYEKSIDEVQKEIIERYAPLGSWVKAVNRQGPDGSMSPLGVIDKYEKMKGWPPSVAYRYIPDGYACHIAWELDSKWYDSPGLAHGEWFHARHIRNLTQSGELVLSAEKPEWSPLYG